LRQARSLSILLLPYFVKQPPSLLINVAKDEIDGGVLKIADTHAQKYAAADLVEAGASRS
jgi:hypothetical protein